MSDVGKYRIVNGREIESPDDGDDVPVKISDVRGLSPGKMTPTGRRVSGVRSVVPDKKVEEYVERSRAALRAAGDLPGLEFDDDGTYRTSRKRSVVGPSIKNTGVWGALRHCFRRIYLHSDGELTDNPIPLSDRQEKITERPPLSTLADEDEGETPITVIPPDFK